MECQLSYNINRCKLCEVKISEFVYQDGKLMQKFERDIEYIETSAKFNTGFIMKNIELNFMRAKQGFKIDLDFINKVYYKFLDFISFGFISKLNNIISESHNDNIKLIDLVDSFINKLDDIDDTLENHRELSKALQLENDKLKLENERLIIVINALESKNISYAKKHDDIDTWLMRNYYKNIHNDN